MVNEPSGKVTGGQPIPEMAQLAKLVMKIGPDIDLIARLSGQYKETIRYRYKEKILSKGFALQARLNFQGLNLQRIIMKVRLGENYAPFAKELSVAMNRICYVTNLSSLMPEGSYLVHANVPRQFKDRFVELMTKIQGLGIFASVEFYTFDWYRNVPMRAEYYDFEHGMWEFNWSKPVEHGKDDHEPGFAPFEFDKVDLLLMKELQIDATRPLSEIREAIKANDGVDINYKTLSWHWVKHVQEKQMIKGYTLRWTGTKYDPKTERLEHRPHRYIFIAVLVREVDEAERVRLTAEMNKVPFIWSEAAGSDYYAEFAFPVEMINDAFVFLKNAISTYGMRAEYHVIDQMNTLSYVISYGLFDGSERMWTFNTEEILARFRSLIMKIGEGSGAGRNPQ